MAIHKSLEGKSQKINFLWTFGERKSRVVSGGAIFLLNSLCFNILLRNQSSYSSIKYIRKLLVKKNLMKDETIDDVQGQIKKV